MVLELINPSVKNIIIILLLLGFVCLRQFFKRRESTREFISKLLGVGGFSYYVLCQSQTFIRLHAKQFSSLSGFLTADVTIWFLVMAIYVSFVVSYLMRTASVDHAKGFWQTLFPLFCAVTPVIMYDSTYYVHMVGKLAILLTPLLPYSKTWNALTITLMLVGNAVMLVSILWLKKSFSIMCEARALVTKGPYRFVRHPLYTGEILAALGVCLYKPSIFNMIFFVIFVVSQIYRAGLEEKKMVAVFPEYGDYKKRTQAFFP